MLSEDDDPEAGDISALVDGSQRSPDDERGTSSASETVTQDPSGSHVDVSTGSKSRGRAATASARRSPPHNFYSDPATPLDAGPRADLRRLLSSTPSVSQSRSGSADTGVRSALASRRPSSARSATAPPAVLLPRPNGDPGAARGTMPKALSRRRSAERTPRRPSPGGVHAGSPPDAPASRRTGGASTGGQRGYTPGGLAG